MPVCVYVYVCAHVGAWVNAELKRWRKDQTLAFSANESEKGLYEKSKA